MVFSADFHCICLINFPQLGNITFAHWLDRFRGGLFAHSQINRLSQNERERISTFICAWASLRWAGARGRICQRLDAHFNTKLINHLSGAGWQNMRAQQLISLSRGARNLTPPLTIILSSLSSLASHAPDSHSSSLDMYPARTIQMKRISSDVLCQTQRQYQMRWSKVRSICSCFEQKCE